MVEANPFKFYVAKYALLVFALVLWLVGAVLLYLDEFTFPNLFIDGLFILVGVILIVAFLKFHNKIKRVVLGKNKFVVLEGDYNVRFEWPEVKSLRVVPFLNLCQVKIRGKRESFYFFAASSFKSALDVLSNNSSSEKTLDIDKQASN